MPVGFGFSVGDFIACLVLIRDSITALQDSKGPTASFQELIQEIDSLKDSLESITDLKLEEKFGPTSKHCIAIRNAINQCRCCIDKFIANVAKYQPWLRTKNLSKPTWMSNIKKIKWALLKKEDVVNLRTQLERQSSSINMLMASLQV